MRVRAEISDLTEEGQAADDDNDQLRASHNLGGMGQRVTQTLRLWHFR